MKIAFFETKDWEREYIKTKLEEHDLEFYEEPLNLENADNVKSFEIISIFIYSKISPDILEKLPKLKLIVTRSTGFEHIDLEECKRRTILVSNVPSYGENTVAEHTFALILSLSRNIHKSYLRTIRKDFSIEGLKGFDIKGKTLGVIGAGHIGLHVIKIAKGFGMKVLAYDTNQNKFLAEVLGFEYVPLKELLNSSDIITLHVPYTKKTHHLIDKDAINQMKKDAILINTSRGGVIDTEAVIDGLSKKILAGVGIDVLETEDLIKEEKQLLYDEKRLEILGNLVKDHLLLSKDNVVYTPHIAFYSQEALERILDTTIQNIISFMANSAQNLVMD